MNIRVGKIKGDKGDIITMPLDESMTNRFVEKQLVQHISYLIFKRKNVELAINPVKKEIFMVGHKDISSEKHHYNNMQTIDMQEVLEMIKKDRKQIPHFENLSQDEIDMLLEVMDISEQIVLFVMTYWLRNGTMTFMFNYHQEKKTMECGLSTKTDMEIMEQIYDSIKNYKTNKEGIFLKREWIDKEDMHKTQGSGKCQN